MIDWGYGSRVALRASAGLVALMFAGAGMAQEASTGGTLDGGEIIVTAQKREQRLQDVGMTITAQSGDQLRTAGVTELPQLSRVVPGLNIVRSQYGFPLVALRGVSTSVPYLSAQPTVSTYVDEALFPYPATAQGAFLDVERVEVLKGPQGTLFGQNVTGGAINIIAAKPTRDPQAGFRADVNNFGGISLEGYVSGPLSEKLRARLAASTEQFGAWQKCYALCNTKNGDANRGAVRLLLDWTPTDTLTVNLNLNANYDHGEPQQFQLTQINIQVPPGLPGLSTYPMPPKDNRAADFAYNNKNHDRTYQAVLRADLDLGNATLTSLTNYINTRRYTQFDNDGTVLPISFFQSYGKVKSIAQELRVTGKMEDPSINYVFGASYQRDNILDGNSSQYFGYTGIPIGGSMVINNPVDYTAKGVFGSVDWEAVNGLTLTAGARYAWLKERTQGCMADAGNGILAGLFNFVANLSREAAGLSPTSAYVPGGCFTFDDRPEVLGTEAAFLPFDADITQKEHNFAWKLGINYKVSQDALFYATVSRGFKAGAISPGYNIVATMFEPIKQERLTSYEIGAKTTLFDRRLTLNGAVFYYDYRDKQFLTLRPTVLGASYFLRNVPKSKLKGVEGEAVVKLIPGLTARGGFTYIDTEVGNFETFNGLGQLVNVKGTRFNYSPAWNGTFDVEYRHEIGGNLEGFGGFSGLYNSSTFADLGETPAYKLPGYTTFDARLGIDSTSGWSASIWIRNLTDKYYLTNTSAGTDILYSATGLPRTWGASARFRF